MVSNHDGKFLEPIDVHYQREGQPVKVWEMVKSSDSVHILVNNTDTGELLFVKQIRIPVLVNDPITEGKLIECCAGIIDDFHEHPGLVGAGKIATQEIREELGYHAVEKLQFIRELKSSVGHTGSNIFMFYAEVKEKDFKGKQLLPDEDIHTIKVPYKDVKSYIEQAVTDTSTAYLVGWWLSHYGQGLS